VRADIGLGPWDVLHQALSIHTGLRFGVAVVVTSLIVLVIAALLGERPGVGTALNALIVGSSFDLFDRLYLGASFGAGPRDSLMLAIVRRGLRIAVASWAIQIGALAIGFAFGGSVGLGTVIFAVGLGPAMEASYWVLMRLGITNPAPAAPSPAGSPAIGST